MIQPRRPPIRLTCLPITVAIRSARCSRRTININVRQPRPPLAALPRPRRPLRLTVTLPPAALTLKQVRIDVDFFSILFGQHIWHFVGRSANHRILNEIKDVTRSSHVRCCISFRCHFGWRLGALADTQPSGIRHCG